MALSHLLYVSRAVRPFTQPQLEHLVAKCQRNNQAREITGLLLYSDGNFMQLLEGKGSVLDEVYSKIQTDDRHTSVDRLLFHSVQQRLFPQWQMGLLNLSGGRRLDKTQFDWLLSHLRHPSTKADRTAPALALLKNFRKQLPAENAA